MAEKQRLVAGGGGYNEEIAANGRGAVVEAVVGGWGAFGGGLVLKGAVVDGILAFSGGAVVEGVVVNGGAVVSCVFTFLVAVWVDSRSLGLDSVMPNKIDARYDWRSCRLKLAGGV